MTGWTPNLRPSVVGVGAYRPGVSGDEIKKRCASPMHSQWLPANGSTRYE